MKTQKEIEYKNDLACVTGMLLKACPLLKKSLPHTYWLEYLHAARYVVKKLNDEECGIVARTAGCFTIEEAVTKAEGKVKG
jgi:hypothetical protein